ncbi:MAG: GAF domain-containing protein [Candidatus Riflebacteria bacterium]|nr:GAF domain-containing protein [Candidatus Riflebacteria bacterium]
MRIDDVTHDQRFFHGVDEKSEFQTHSLLAVPLCEAGEVSGAVQVLNKTAGRPFDQSDEDLLVALADQAGTAIHNSRTYHKLLDERRRLQAIVDGLADGIVVTDGSGEVHLVNAAAAAMFGLSRGNPRSLSFDVFLHNLDRLAAVGSGDVVLLKPQGRVLSAQVTSIGGFGGRLGRITALRDSTVDRSGQRRRDEYHAVAAHELERLASQMAQAIVHDPALAPATATALELERQCADIVRFQDIEFGPVRLLRRDAVLEDLAREVLKPREQAFRERSIRLRFRGNPARASVDTQQLGHALGTVLDASMRMIPTSSSLIVAIEDSVQGPAITIAGLSSDAEVSRAEDLLEVEKLVTRYLATIGQEIDLALAHARHIVSSHGGSLSIERPSSGHFCFRLSLLPGTAKGGSA